jgi:hypothetical protein
MNLLMAPTRDLSLLLLLLLHTSLLALRGCNATLEITDSPTSQVVVLGENATFHCSASGGSFQWTINITSRSNPYSLAYTTTIREYGITAQIDSEETDNGVEYTAALTIEGRMETNNTQLHCVVFTFNSHRESETVTLTVIGPPDTPSLTIPEQHVDLELRQLSAFWNVPYSHADHSITHYDVTVTNTHRAGSYDKFIAHSATSGIGGMNITLPFPHGTSSCDVLTISVTAVNDVGAGKPAQVNVSIPEVPDSEVSVVTEVFFQKDGSPVVILEIEFPKLCSFERLNYSVVLVQPREALLIEKSVIGPPVSVTETITSSLEPNTDYSIVVLAKTAAWNTSTPHYNFSTYFTPTTMPMTTDNGNHDTTTTTGMDFTPMTISTVTDNGLSPTTKTGPVPTVPPETNSMQSHYILGATAGAAALVLLLIIAALTLLCVLHLRKRKSGIPTSDDESKTDSMPYDLTPNPIYDGPLYDTVQEPFKQLLTLKPQPTTVPVTEPIYSDSPSHDKQRHGPGSGYEEVALCKKEAEDCYIQMQSYKRQ